MNTVDRSELLPVSEYERVRPQFRQRAIALTKLRRVQLGAHMALMFENHDTVLLQLQELLRTDRITDEQSIARELETHNERIPAAGSLSATLSVEYERPGQRREMLRRLMDLEGHVLLRCGEQRIAARFRGPSAEEQGRLPAVHYVSFELSEAAQELLHQHDAEVALTVDHPAYTAKVPLSRETRQQLLEDLR